MAIALIIYCNPCPMIGYNCEAFIYVILVLIVSSTSCTSCGENAIYNSIAGTCSCVGTSVDNKNKILFCRWLMLLFM